MPGIIQGSVSVAVMPKFLSEVFTQDREVLARLNEYKDATNTAGLIVFNSRRKWVIKPKGGVPKGGDVGQHIILTLRNFYTARDGGKEPFYMYDFSESTPMGNYDATGTDPNGRFLVRFDGSWENTNTAGIVSTGSMTLVELADSGSGPGQLDYSKTQSFFQFGL